MSEKNPKYVDYKEDSTYREIEKHPVVGGSPIYVGIEAQHQLGDISRDEPDLFSATGETDTAYYGAWIEGFGYIGVMFPKNSVRKATEEEKQEYCKGIFGCSNGQRFSLKPEEFA